MFYIHSGCYSDFAVHACTEDEELAKLYCAIHNSRCFDEYDCYDYSRIDKIEDIYSIDKSLVNMFCTSKINVDIDNGQYEFRVGSTFISSKTDYMLNYDIRKRSYDLVADTKDEDKYDNTLKRYNLIRSVKKCEDNESRITYKLTIENFITNSDDYDIVLKSAQDYFYKMLDLTDGVVDVDKWNAHEILTKGSKYKRFISICFDINSWDFTPETIDDITIEVYRDYIASINEYNKYPKYSISYEDYSDELSYCIRNVNDFCSKGLHFKNIEVVNESDTDEESYNEAIRNVKKHMIENRERIKEAFYMLNRR